MNRFKHVIWLFVAAGCGDAVDRPPTTPPPPWGVPITGGSMLVTQDGHYAITADPDRDQIVTIDLTTNEIATQVALAEGDQPGRLVEDGAGRIHVALRQGGALLSFASPTDEAPLRRTACAEPRGLAWQASTDQIHVACTGGELVSFAAASGDAVRRVRLDRDLRDVLVVGDALKVTRFRTAELLTLDASGAIIDRVAPPIVQRRSFGGDFGAVDIGPSGGDLVNALPAVAWRTVALADGSVLISHQRQVKARMRTTPGGYGMGCGGEDGPVEAAVTVVRPGQAPFAVSPVISGTLPVDLAVSPAGDLLAFVTAGTHQVHQVFSAALVSPDREEEECGGHQDASTPIDDQLGAPTSVAYTPDNKLVIFYPESPAIVIHDGSVAQTIVLPGTFGYDSGRAMFHRQTGSGLACASCHPEGRDDGLIWEFENIGFRRTQSLAGGILDRAPYHWNGDMTTLDMLMHDVFTGRMAGGELTHSQTVSLGPWLDRIAAPAAQPSADADTIARGKALFDSADVGCAGCHNGALLTNNQIMNVGTGGFLKVPSLVGVAARAPFMHDGCATTLRDRFGACGGGDAHGKTSLLGEAELADLVGYLESL